MYCPGCGQQQVSNETRFCSKCGLQLGLVAELLAFGGTLPQLDALNEKRGKILTRRNGLIASLFWFIFFVLIFTPFWGIVDVDELAAMSAIIGIFGSLLIMLTSFFFLEKKQPKLKTQILEYNNQPQSLYGVSRSSNALPPQQSIPVTDYVPPIQGNWRDTNDLVQPSVTERTTKLLERED